MPCNQVSAAQCTNLPTQSSLLPCYGRKAGTFCGCGCSYNSSFIRCGCRVNRRNRVSCLLMASCLTILAWHSLVLSGACLVSRQSSLYLATPRHADSNRIGRGKQFAWQACLPSCLLAWDAINGESCLKWEWERGEVSKRTNHASYATSPASGRLK